MLIEFDHAQNLSGSEFAVKRFEKYRGLVFWKEKQIYMKTMIYRAQRKYNSNPCALYAAWHDGILLVSENLSGIKTEVKSEDEIMTYQVTVTLRSGDVIKGVTVEHPVLEEGLKGHLVTLHMFTDDEMDTLVNMADVTMVQCKREVDENDPLLMKLTKSRIGYYNPIKRTWENGQ